LGIKNWDKRQQDFPVFWADAPSLAHRKVQGSGGGFSVPHGAVLSLLEGLFLAVVLGLKQKRWWERGVS